jgi:acyl-coenzyme A thioesterase PaaI-like protein
MISISTLTDPKKLMGTLFLRYFGLTQVRMLWFISPELIFWSDEQVKIRVPLNRKTRNHLHCMYFGALAAGADLAAGFHAFAEIRRTKKPISFIFKNMQCNFIKRAEGDVVFQVDDGILIRDLVTKAIETGERVDLPVHVKALCPEKLGDEVCAEFTLTLSLKLKDKNKKNATETIKQDTAKES